MSLRLLTLNIAHGRGVGLYQGFTSRAGIHRNLDRIARYLQQVNADLVCLQEVDAHSHWNKEINLLETLRVRAGFEHSAHGIHNRREGRKPLAYGNGILSRYPIEFWESNPFGQSSIGEKGFLYAEVRIDQCLLPVINLHLDYRSRRRRLTQAEQVIDYIRNRRHPGEERPVRPLICGDFNTHSKRKDDAVRHLFAFILERGHYKLYPESVRTFPSVLPSRSLDFIFLPDHLKATHCEVSRRFLSDHRPVLLECELADG